LASSNLTLDATINPDFGQVEADPSVLNLSAFEQFYGERRPFFLEGTGIFSFDIDCNDGQCTGPFYSRRIGRPPQTGFLSDDPGAVPTSTTILGAAKLTGRFSNGMSLGIMNALTSREAVADSITVEPQSNDFVARPQQDHRRQERVWFPLLSREPQPGRSDSAVPAQRGIRRRHRLPASLWRERQSPGYGPCAGEHGAWIRGGYRTNAALGRPLLSAP
jgi:hypothetical protein